MFSQVLTGTRLTFEVSLLVGVIATVLSVLIGVTAAYLGGIWDDAAVPAHQRVPGDPGAAVADRAARLPVEQGQTPTIIVLAGLGWPWGARVIRAQTLTIRNRDFIAASRETGETTWRIIIFEIIPNEISLIAANFVNTVLYALGASVALAFIGIANLTSFSLGVILYWAQSRQRAAERRLVVVDPAGPRRRAHGHLPGAAQLRHRRDRQPAAARLARDGPDRGHASGPPTPPRCCPSSPRPAARSGVRSYSFSRSSLLERTPRPEVSFCEPDPGDQPTCPSCTGREGGDVRAVEHVSLTLNPGEVVGLCGESGSGKSTLAYGATRLLRPPALVTSGSVNYGGRRITQGGDPVDLLAMTHHELRAMRWREIAIVFQSAMNALNPVLRVQDQTARRDPRAPEDAQARGHEKAADAARPGRHPAQPAPLLPARAVRRHAAARDDRDGPGDRPRGRHHGRADHRARRGGAAGHPGADRGAQGDGSASRSCSSPTTCRCCSSWPTGSRSCTRAG